jgi:protein TonB
MLKQILILILLLIANSFFYETFSQKTEGNFYVFNADWTPAKSLDDCTYFMQAIKKSDTEYVCRYYNKNGPMVKQETYKDAELSTPNGRFCWYNEKGKIDSCGIVKNFKKDRRWDYFFGDSTTPTYYQYYDNGKFVKQSSYSNNTGDNDDLTQKEATFPSGSKGWIKYLTKNLVTPDRLIKTLGRGKYIVTVCFLIDKQGKIGDLYLRKSVEWSADAEVFSIFQKSPAWIPAVQKGEPVNYRQAENITFSVN